MYGRDVTPNTHALSERFVTLDHFFASGGNSADGHQWLTQANETEYPMWPLYYGRSYPSEGEDRSTYSSGGFLWESAQVEGKDASQCSASMRRRRRLVSTAYGARMLAQYARASERLRISARAAEGALSTRAPTFRRSIARSSASIRAGHRRCRMS